MTRGSSSVTMMQSRGLSLAIGLPYLCLSFFVYSVMIGCELQKLGVKLIFVK